MNTQPPLESDPGLLWMVGINYNANAYFYPILYTVSTLVLSFTGEAARIVRHTSVFVAVAINVHSSVLTMHVSCTVFSNSNTHSNANVHM